MYWVQDLRHIRTSVNDHIPQSLTALCASCSITTACPCRGNAKQYALESETGFIPNLGALRAAPGTENAFSHSLNRMAQVGLLWLTMDTCGRKQLGPRPCAAVLGKAASTLSGISPLPSPRFSGEVALGLFSQRI